MVALAECMNSDVLDGEGGRESERESERGAEGDRLKRLLDTDGEIRKRQKK